MKGALEWNSSQSPLDYESEVQTTTLLLYCHLNLYPIQLIGDTSNINQEDVPEDHEDMVENAEVYWIFYWFFTNVL